MKVNGTYDGGQQAQFPGLKILGFCPGGSHRRKAGFDLAVHRCLAEVPE